MSIPAAAIIVGIEPRLAIPMSRPRRPVDRDAARAGAGRAETRDALAEQVVGGAVVGLARVAEATRDGAEHHRGAELGVAERVQEMEPTVGLDVEDQVVLGLRLVGQLMAHLDTRGVHEHVDVIVRGTHRVDHRGNGRGVGEVDLVPARGTACCLHRVDRLARGGGPLETAQLPLDERRRRALPACLDPLGQVALEAVAVGVEALEVGIAGVGLGGEVEKMERAGCRGRQVGDDRGDDAAGRAGHHEHGVGGERARRVSPCRLLVEAHTPSVAVGVPDLDRAGVGRGLGHQDVGERGGLAARRDVDRLDQGIGPLARERLREARDRSAHRLARRRRGRSRDARRGGSRSTRNVPVARTSSARARMVTASSFTRTCKPSRHAAGSRTVVGVVERRKPVHAVHRAAAGPACKLGFELIDRRRALEHERLDAELLQARDERGGDAAAVGHHDDPAPRAQRDAGGRAPLQRWAQHRDRYPPREGARLRPGGWRRGLGGCRRRPRWDAATFVSGAWSCTNATTWASVG